MLTRLEELKCRERGFDIHQASAKRVHDAKEVYDGVPSMHDAKSATVIARFYWDGLTTPWQELNPQQRELNALAREYDIHQSQYLRNLNRLEVCLGRHWPECQPLLALIPSHWSSDSLCMALHNRSRCIKGRLSI